MLIRYAAVAALCLFVSACGTVQSTAFKVSTEEKLTFDFQDHRPPPERTGGYSKVAGTEVTQLGDENITPPGPVLLRSWLHTKGPSSLEGKRVVLNEFLVQVYDPPVGQWAGAGLTAAGPVGMLLGHAMGSAASNKVVTVRIAGTVEGQDFFGVGRGTFKGRVSENDINTVITEALEMAVAKIAAVVAMGTDTNVVSQ